MGVGSSVDNAAAPVSPLNSPPKLLDFRRCRGIVSLSRVLDLEALVERGRCWTVAPTKEYVCDAMADLVLGLIKFEIPIQPINV